MAASVEKPMAVDNQVRRSGSSRLGMICRDPMFASCTAVPATMT
jgi:hypothetical protein